jgi:GntR family transcriptional regulator, arabinose operon transcriptional repressor
LIVRDSMRTNFTKYQEVTSRLREMIDEMFKAGQVKLPTEQALGAKWGVSRGTVRKAMEELVSARILQRIAGSGTFINREMLSDGVFARKNIKTVVLIYDILEISDFRYRIIRGVVKAANSKGYDTAIASFENAMEIFREKFFSTDSKDTAMVSCNFSTEHIKQIKEFPARIPYVALNDYRYSDIAQYAVLGRPWLEYGLNYLPQIGHKKILIFHDMLTKPYIEEVRNAVRDVKDKSGINLDVTVKECRYEYNRVVSELNSIFVQKSQPAPTAILCLDDKIAAWTISHLRNIGVNVPEDISVLGTGDFDICESTYPRITTTCLDYDLMGEMAIDMIDKQLEGKAVDQSLAFVANKLIERDSCRPI